MGDVALALLLDARLLRDRVGDALGERARQGRAHSHPGDDLPGVDVRVPAPGSAGRAETSA